MKPSITPSLFELLKSSRGVESQGSYPNQQPRGREQRERINAIIHRALESLGETPTAATTTIDRRRQARLQSRRQAERRRDPQVAILLDQALLEVSTSIRMLSPSRSQPQERDNEDDDESFHNQ